MKDNIIRGSFYFFILVSIAYFFFSALELINVSSLYKDQVEMRLFTLSINATSTHEDYESLFDHAIELNNWINFFQYSVIITPFVILWLFTLKRKMIKKV